MEVEEFDYRLSFPSSLVVAGSSFSGKTFFVIDLLKNRDKVFKSKVKKVVYVYSHFQDKFLELSNDKEVTFISDKDEIESKLEPGTLLIYDDQMLNFERNSKCNFEITNWVIRRVHHEQIGLIIILQNLYPKSLRCMLINVMYLVLYKNIRDKRSIQVLSAQFAPSKSRYLLEAMEDVSLVPYKYLLFDFSPEMNDRFRVRNFLYPVVDMKVYIPKVENESSGRKV